jgi:glycosyltransferase involved in cell wall biosynthesis
MDQTAFPQPGPLVSVVIPTYNRANLLVEAVGSCLNQTWPYLQVVIVDDGSTDETEAVVTSQLADNWKDKLIAYVRQPNQGAATARNRGMALATGKYIQFLDSDDILFPDKIALQVDALERPENNSAEGCSCFGLMGESVSAKNERIGIKCNSPGEYLQKMSSRVVHGMQTSAPLWRRSFLLKRPGWCTHIDLGDGDDLEYTIRLLSAATKIAFVDQELFLLRVHTGVRLSVINKTRTRILRTVRTRQAVYATLEKTGNWNATTQKNYLKLVQTAYINLLECGTIEDIRSLESWIISLAQMPRLRIFLPMTIFFRKILGRRMVLMAYSLWSKAREH